MKRNLCLFAHFDRQGIVDPYVLRYLAAIRACGFQIVLISTNLHASQLSKLDGLCCDVLVRANVGLDFGSWQDGYRKHGETCDGDLLLANDSVYGPIGDLPATMERLRQAPADVCGMVESHQHAAHLQSWFILMNARAHRSETFQGMIDQPFGTMEKSLVIANGEIGLTGAMRRAGFRVAALYPEHRPGFLQRNLNPTHTLWKELIEAFGVPFLKVELLRTNPIRIENVGDWRQVVGARAPDLVALIDSHLDRLHPGWAARDTPVRPVSSWSTQTFLQRACVARRARQPITALQNDLGFLLCGGLNRGRHVLSLTLRALHGLRRT